jgi:glucan biosynthesis protein C
MCANQLQGQGRLLALDFVRVAALLGVVIYHCAAAYSTNTPYWSVHDGGSAVATGIRELVDVFIMPVFFFLAGYFALSSLRRRGYWYFFKSKFWELGFIWLLVVLVILPILWWGIDVKTNWASVGFVEYWLTWMRSIGQTRLGVATDTAQMVHMHFWFVSLLFYFFLIFIAIWKAKDKLFRTTARMVKPVSPSNNSLLPVLLIFGLITTAGYYVSLLLVPDTSWLTVNLFLQFQPAKIFLYIAYFSLGIYGSSRNWFNNGSALGRLSIWAPAMVALSAVFLIVGQDVFLNPSTNSLSPGNLLLFAFVRSFFLLSVLVTFSSSAVKYFNRPSRVIHTLSDNSYYIYLIHAVVVSIFQDILMVWPQGPAVVKMIAVFALTLATSYALSRWVFKKMTLRKWVNDLFHSRGKRIGLQVPIEG